MDTTVPTGIGGRVHNIGLLSDRQTYLFVSGILLLVGSVLFGFSTLRATNNQQTGSRNMLWMVTLLMVGSLVAWGIFDRKLPPAPAEPPLSIPSAKEPSVSSLLLDMEPFTVKLSGSENYMQTSFSFSISQSSDKIIIQDSNSKIRSAINVLLSGKTREQVTGSQNLIKLSEEIRETANLALGGKAKIDDVFFTSILTQ